jgi:hypothetical protein
MWFLVQYAGTVTQSIHDKHSIVALRACGIAHEHVGCTWQASFATRMRARVIIIVVIIADDHFMNDQCRMHDCNLAEVYCAYARRLPK